MVDQNPEGRCRPRLRVAPATDPGAPGVVGGTRVPRPRTEVHSAPTPAVASPEATAGPVPLPPGRPPAVVWVAGLEPSRPWLQRVVELVLGLPRGSVVALRPAEARRLRRIVARADEAIQARDRQIADLRHYMIRHGLMEGYWAEVVARETAKARGGLKRPIR